jgi:glutathionylspermidine synthase
MGFPWAVAELLAQEPPCSPLVGRFDFVKATDGRWRLLEYNADTPSGVREGLVCDRLVHAACSNARQLDRVSGRLGEAIAAQFEAALADEPPGGVLGLVTTAGELEDLAQMAFTRDLLAPGLARRGLEVILGDADNLALTRRGLMLCGRRVDALYRYLPIETVFGTPTFALMYDAAMAGRVRLLNGLYGLLLQNKALMAALWAARDDSALDADARVAIKEHLPATWLIDGVPAGVERRELVAKQVFGREGHEVFFGEDTTDTTWRALVARRTYVAQARVRIEPLTAVVQTSLGPRVEEGHATVGCFVVGGRLAGCYTRFGGKIVTSRSKWLATFVEADQHPARCAARRADES